MIRCLKVIHKPVLCSMTTNHDDMIQWLKERLPHLSEAQLAEIAPQIRSHIDQSPQLSEQTLVYIASDIASRIFGEGNQIGTVSVESIAGRDNIDGSIEVTHGGQLDGTAIGVNLGTIILGHDPNDAVRRQIKRYLDQLADSLYKLRLNWLNPLAHATEGIPLPHIYVQLAVKEEIELIRGRPEDEDIRRYFQNGNPYEPVAQQYDPGWALPHQAITIYTPEGGVLPRRPEERPILPRELVVKRARLVPEMVEQHRRLVLLGDPGSGKSTFFAHLTWEIVQKLQHEQSDERSAHQTGIFYTLPISIPMRVLSHRLAHGGETDNTVFQTLLGELLLEQRDLAPDLEDDLRKALTRGTALLLFDGLDEVPLETTRGGWVSREETLRAVQSFAQRYIHTPVILTCRTRAFDERFRRILGWKTTTIAPWTLGQIRIFVRRWYDAQVRDRLLEQERADKLCNDLIDTIEKRPRLRDMARTPLLMTMMALVLRQEGRLPRDRAGLYERILDLLLGQWDAVRHVQNLSEAVGLPEWDIDRFRFIIYELAYHAHSFGQDENTRGQLAASTIREKLARFFKQMNVPKPHGKAEAFLEYIDQRSGLLIPESNDTYVFAHLTMQEYCAGCYMKEDDDMDIKVLEHRSDDRWREPIKLGLGKADSVVLKRVLQDLVERQYQGTDKPTTRWYRDLLLVAEIGEDHDWNMLRSRGSSTTRIDRLQQQLREGLVVLLDDARQPLPFEERRQAAEYLARLGDPRIPIAPSSYATSEYVKAKKYWYPFPNKAIARQAYIIGGWDSPAKATLPIAAFWITRYPITVAQFAEFVTEGYSSNGKRWWTGAGWEWKTTTGRTAPDGWNPKYANQPVVGVTWYEATAFAAWLNEHIQQQHPHWQARLPTEAEWEAAAASAPDGSRRPYPWGTEQPNDELAVFEASQLNSPPPVGLCPKGSASCGVLDMAGTVSEWVSSVYSRYPQHSHQVQNDVRPGDPDIAIRGGSFRNKSDSLQCGKRIRMRPEQSLDSVGFRLVVVKRT